MPDPMKKTARPLLLGVLWALALPIIVIRAIARAFAAGRVRRIVRSGFLTCRFCGRGNRLDVLVRCRCGFSEFRSIALPCSECGNEFSWIDCSTCGASLRLP